MITPYPLCQCFHLTVVKEDSLNSDRGYTNMFSVKNEYFIFLYLEAVECLH